MHVTCCCSGWAESFNQDSVGLATWGLCLIATPVQTAAAPSMQFVSMQLSGLSNVGSPHGRVMLSLKVCHVRS